MYQAKVRTTPTEAVISFPIKVNLVKIGSHIKSFAKTVTEVKIVAVWTGNSLSFTGFV